MQNRLMNLDGTKPIMENWDDLNEGFANAEAELDAAKAVSEGIQAEVIGHKASSAAHAAEHITYVGAVAGAEDLKSAVDSVKQQLDSAVMAGDSGAAAAQAAIDVEGVKHPSLKARIDSDVVTLSEQLAETADTLRVTQNSPFRGLGACLTFIDDDVREFIRTIWQQIIDDMGIKISFAVIPGKVDTPGYLTKKELLALQAAGHDLLSHGYAGIDVPNVDLATVDADFRDGQNWMKANGMNGYEYVVYSGGLQNTRVDVKNLARKYYKYGIGAWTFGTNYNASPVDNWCLARVNEDGSDLATLKGYLDEAIANNGWLIVMTHSHTMTAASIPKIKSLIGYAQDNGVPILPFTEAVKRKGNAVALGEFTQPGSRFVSVEGKGNNGLFVKDPVTTHPIDAPITAYEKGSVTAHSVDLIRDTFKGQGGTVTVFRNSNSDVYSYRTFIPINEHTEYKSRWDIVANAWTPFKALGSEYRLTYGVALNEAHAGILQYSIDYKNRVWLRGQITLGVASTIGTMYAAESFPEFDTPLLFRNFSQSKNSIGAVIAPNGIIYIDSDAYVAGNVIQINMMYQA